MNSSAKERRREPRQAASGELRLLLEGHRSEEVRGRLLDVSRSGFRAVHQYAGLSAGQQVRFRHPLAEGSARVMWTRVIGERVESGFLIVSA